jgi:mRNA interferase MazF
MSYIPNRGDIVWINFDPQAGHEQAGRRPALVLTPEIYNRKSGLVIACPITSQIKGYPFEVPIPDDLAISGVVLVDQVKNMDWRARLATYAGEMPGIVMDDVFDMLSELLQL